MNPYYLVWPHQQDLVARFQRGRARLFVVAPRGTGRTAPALTILRHYGSRSTFRVVVCDVSMLRDWAAILRAGDQPVLEVDRDGAGELVRARNHWAHSQGGGNTPVILISVHALRSSPVWSALEHLPISLALGYEAPAASVEMLLERAEAALLFTEASAEAPPGFETVHWSKPHFRPRPAVRLVAIPPTTDEGVFLGLLGAWLDVHPEWRDAESSSLEGLRLAADPVSTMVTLESRLSSGAVTPDDMSEALLRSAYGTALPDTKTRALASLRAPGATSVVLAGSAASASLTATVLQDAGRWTVLVTAALDPDETLQLLDTLPPDGGFIVVPDAVATSLLLSRAAAVVVSSLPVVAATAAASARSLGEALLGTPNIEAVTIVHWDQQLDRASAAAFADGLAEMGVVELRHRWEEIAPGDATNDR